MTGESAAKIRIEAVHKSYRTTSGRELNVLKGVDYAIAPRDFVTIIGPSGCGKTTLLNIIAGLLSATSGRVLLDGIPVERPGRELGMIFQQDAIFLWRTVMGNVEFGLEIQGIEKAERRSTAGRYLRLVGLEGFEHYFPKELSGGMRKRVAIATVLANRPEILLMDEPFGSLDYVTKITLQREVLRIWLEEHITTIFVTHDIEEALFLSTKVLVIVAGVIKEVLEVPFGYPRTDALRTSESFQRMKERLWLYMIPEESEGARRLERESGDVLA